MTSDRETPKVRWGVISTANIGRVAVGPAIRASRNGTLVAIASRNGERASTFARDHAIPRAHPSYEALLDDPDVDAVYIPLPNSLHREWSIRAARAGKHVLCEKPLALDPEECLDMEAAARECGVKLMEAFMYRFHPRIDTVRTLIAEGVVGEMGTIRSAFTFRLRRLDNIRLDPSLGGGALMDVGCYCVNVSRTLAGAEPIRVHAVANWTPRGIDDHLMGMLEFDSGVFAHLDCSLTQERREVFEVSGTQGTIIVPNAFLPGTADAAIHVDRGRDGLETRWVDGADEYQLMVEHFNDCVLYDRTTRYGVDEAARNMRVIGALLESARKGGAPVDLPAG